MTSSWFFLSTLNYDARSTTHQIHSKLVLVMSHRYGSSWSVLTKDTHLTCTTAFDTPDPLVDIIHFHTTIAINSFLRPWISIGAQPSSVKSSTTDCCFMWKSDEALITNEHYCLRASNTELKLSTNILHCINYRTHVQMFLSSQYQWHHLAGDLTYQSTYVQTRTQSFHGSVKVKQSLYRPGVSRKFRLPDFKTLGKWWR